MDIVTRAKHNNLHDYSVTLMSNGGLKKVGVLKEHKSLFPSIFMGHVLSYGCRHSSRKVLPNLGYKHNCWSWLSPSRWSKHIIIYFNCPYTHSINISRCLPIYVNLKFSGNGYDRSSWALNFFFFFCLSHIPLYEFYTSLVQHHSLMIQQPKHKTALPRGNTF